jgi:hypothetical protein
LAVRDISHACSEAGIDLLPGGKQKSQMRSQSIAGCPVCYRVDVESTRRAVSDVGDKADIADQRSSKFAGLFASSAWPVVPWVQGECDRIVAAVAATASRATAANPVILRCFVIRTSSRPQPSLWVARTLRRFNSDPTSMGCANGRMDNEAVPNFARGRASSTGQRAVTTDNSPFAISLTPRPRRLLGIERKQLADRQMALATRGRVRSSCAL